MNATFRRNSLRRLAKVAWLVIAAAAVVLFVVNEVRVVKSLVFLCAADDGGCLPFATITRQDLEMFAATGLPPAALAWIGAASSWAARLSLALIGSAIYWLRPNDWVAWLLSLTMMTTLAEGIGPMGELQILADAVFVIAIASWLPVPFVFPNGRIEPPRIRWLLLALAILAFPAWLPAMTGLWERVPMLQQMAVIVTIMWAALGGYSLIYRYRYSSNAVERQQTKWVVAGFLAVFAASTLYMSFQSLFPPWQPSEARLAALLITSVTYPLGYGAFAASLAFAILRHRLWDIDVVIRRTLLYTLLSVLLAFIYVGGVTGLQQAMHGLTGRGDTAAIIATTLLIAALFQPLRQRLQRFIDRRFYRRKYDAAKTLAAFGASASADVDLEGVTGRLLAVVDDTLQPASASLWLRPPAVQK